MKSTSCDFDKYHHRDVYFGQVDLAYDRLPQCSSPSISHSSSLNALTLVFFIFSTTFIIFLSFPLAFFIFSTNIISSSSATTSGIPLIYFSFINF